uniref:BTB domain-containing protein n=1 Tax=Panagrolaimus davidi TaxID=227884 RepID=A0A914PWR8_9BILA
MTYDQFDDENPDISVFFHCYSFYDDIEIEANFRLAVKLFVGQCLDTMKVRGTKCSFNKNITVVECYSKEDWNLWNKKGEFLFQVCGHLVIKKGYTIPLSIKAPKIYQQMFADDNGKNFKIFAEGQEIKVHKSILQKVSSVFARMFELSWKETTEEKIEFKFITFKLAKIAIDLFYGIKYLGFLDKIEYIQLFQFADQYDITPLKNAVKNSIILTPKNVVEYTNLVAENKCDELIRHCIDYLILCSQYSLEIKDVGKITDTVKIQIADLMFLSEFIKKDVEDENIHRVNQHLPDKRNDNIDPFTIQSNAEIIDHQEVLQNLHNLLNQNQQQLQLSISFLEQQRLLEQQQQLLMLINTIASNQQQ